MQPFQPKVVNEYGLDIEVLLKIFISKSVVLLSSHQTFPQKKSLKVEIDILRGKYFFYGFFLLLLRLKRQIFSPPADSFIIPRILTFPGLKFVGNVILAIM